MKCFILVHCINEWYFYKECNNQYCHFFLILISVLILKAAQEELVIKEKQLPFLQRMTNLSYAGNPFYANLIYILQGFRSSNLFVFDCFASSIFSIATVIKQAGCPVPDYMIGFKKLKR